LLSDPQQVSKARVFLVFFKWEKYFFSETEKKKDKLGATFLGSLTDPEAQVLTRMKSKAKSIATPTENSIMNALKILTTMEFQKLLYGIFVADLHGLFPKHSWKACYTFGRLPLEFSCRLLLFLTEVFPKSHSMVIEDLGNSQ